MSETFRKRLWFLLLILAASLPAVGCFPVKCPEMQTFASRGYEDPLLIQIPRLAPDDPANRGSAEALTRLPGIGTVIAGALVQERETNGIFHYPEDLAAVKGIGEKKLEQIRPFLTVLSDESEE